MKVKNFVEKISTTNALTARFINLSTCEIFFEFSELNLRSLLLKTAFWYDSCIFHGLKHPFKDCF